MTVVSKSGNPGLVAKALAQIRIFLMRNYRLWDEKNNMVKLFQIFMIFKIIFHLDWLTFHFFLKVLNEQLGRNTLTCPGIF